MRMLSRLVMMIAMMSTRSTIDVDKIDDDPLAVLEAAGPALPSDLNRRSPPPPNHPPFNWARIHYILRNRKCEATALLPSSPCADLWGPGCTGELLACLHSPMICQSDHRPLYDKLGVQEIKHFQYDPKLKNEIALTTCAALHAKSNGAPDTPLTTGLTLADGLGAGFGH